MWLYVTETRSGAERMLRDVLAPMLGRPVDELRELALPIGSADQCAERISDYQDAGAERIFVWPLADELDQLERFRNDVVPLSQVLRTHRRGRYLKIAPHGRRMRTEPATGRSSVASLRSKN